MIASNNTIIATDIQTVSSNAKLLATKYSKLYNQISTVQSTTAKASDIVNLIDLLKACNVDTRNNKTPYNATISNMSNVVAGETKILPISLTSISSSIIALSNSHCYCNADCICETNRNCFCDSNCCDSDCCNSNCCDNDCCNGDCSCNSVCSCDTDCGDCSNSPSCSDHCFSYSSSSTNCSCNSDCCNGDCTCDTNCSCDGNCSCDSNCCDIDKYKV